MVPSLVGQPLASWVTVASPGAGDHEPASFIAFNELRGLGEIQAQCPRRKQLTVLQRFQDQGRGMASAAHAAAGTIKVLQRTLLRIP